MRRKFTAGALIALAFLVPAAPAMAQTKAPGLNAACQAVERTVYKDIRELVTIDLDTATNQQLRILSADILAATDSLPVLPDRIQARLKGTPDELRAYLKKDLQTDWLTALRISVGQTMTGAGPNVKAAAQKVLDEQAVDAYLAYLNDGLYAARALDCKSQPTATPTSRPTATPTATPSVSPSVSPSATTTVVPTPASSTTPAGAGGGDGGLPVTGAQTATVAGIGAALLLIGGVVYVIGRRRRARFVA
ncbi:LPXTG cell wall anchor domain-containing protein [Micromonospora sp. NPDC048898]|uniref:LPXTG cell wall anchor domain-containing protein n=1 Tax=Micromonospora sp. NPDC048898 TaxID=3364260 RepID=UPI00371CAE62